MKSFLIKSLSIFTFVLTLFLSAGQQEATAEEMDWTGYAGMLADHVKPGEKDGIRLNLVDYNGWEKDTRWPILRTGLQHADEPALTQRKQRLAFWINAYNIMAINVVLEHRPLKSIRDAGSLFASVWGKSAGMVAGKVRSLHDIEHLILRTMGEPRMHFAIVCASVSCPDLRAEPYLASQLDVQLDDQAQRFLTNPGKGVRQTDAGVAVSKIFKWFEDDFTPQGGVVGMIKRYGRQGETVSDVDYLDYDWSLNGALSAAS